MRTQLITHVERDHMSALLRAFDALGLSGSDVEEHSRVWLHSLKQPDGFPIKVEIEASIPDASGSAVLRISPQGNESTLTIAKIMISLEVDPGDTAAGRRALARMLKRLDEERRLECIGVNHFLGISRDLEIQDGKLIKDEPAVRDFMKKTNMNYPVLWDTENVWGALYNGFGLPTTVILDREHRMRFRHNNIVDKATLDAEVSTLLNESMKM